jgi:hypothetical protein
MQAVVYRKLSELVDNYNTTRRPNADIWVKRFFESLDWGGRPTYSLTTDEGFGYQLRVDKFPVINILTSPPSNVDRVYSALNRAYNQDVPWVVATDFRSLGLYGSYWYSFRHDVSSALALQVEYKDYLLEAHQLELLTPDEVSRNHLQELYQTYTGRKQRLPLDKHLIDRMAGWRRLVLDALGETAIAADALVHRLINTMFLIRYMEDTGNQVTEQRLLTFVETTSDADFSSILKTTFERIGERTGYNVPTLEELNSLHAQPLRSLTRQLYGYPEAGIEYDFGEMSVDVLGRFYEEYLRLQVTPVQEARPTMTLFEQAPYEFTNMRRERGIFYTPRYIVDYILTDLIDRYKATHSNGPLPRVADLASGSGTFLAAAVDHLASAYPKLGTDISSLADAIVGLDVDPRAIEATRLNLTARFLRLQPDVVVPQLKLQRHDLLFHGPSSKNLLDVLPKGCADIIVGNPPYIPYDVLQVQYPSDEIQSRFQTAEKKYDSYILFVEAALDLLCEGGFGGLVLPNIFLRGNAASGLRQWLADRSDILEIIDFLDQPVFLGVGVYTFLLLFRKKISQTSESKLKVTVARIFKISSTPATQLANISVANNSVANNLPQDGLEVFRDDQPSGRGAWIFQSRQETELNQLLKKASDEVVKDVFEIRQGIKTGADDIFVVETTSIDKNISIILGKEPNQIENKLLVPVFRNRDMKRWQTRPRHSLIFPYDQKNGELILWKDLERVFPAGAAYLTANKSKLTQRRSLSNDNWYGLIRARAETVTSSLPRMFVSELSLRPNFCLSSVAGTAILGSTGGGSWMLLKDNSYDRSVLLAYLNSVLAEWFLRQISSLRKGGYILLEQQSLARLPLPRFLKDNNSFAQSEIKRLSSYISDRVGHTSSSIDPQLRHEVNKVEEQIDGLILEAVGLTASQANYVREKVMFSRGGR